MLSKLNKNIINFESFRRQISDYFKFRDRLKQKGQSYLQGLTNNSSSADKNESVNDKKFTFSCMQRLISECDNLEIEISADVFNSVKIREELTRYERWKLYAEAIFKRLEKELN